MKRLIYRIAEPQQVVMRDSKRVITTESGQPDRTQRIPTGPARVRNIPTGDTLKVLNEDLDYLLPSLQWRTGDYNVDFAMPVQRGWKSTEWRIPGRFTPQLNKKEISQIVEDYKLLGKHFRRYEDMFGPKAQEKLLPFLEFVLLRQEIILKHSTNLKLRTEIKERAGLPGWMARMLELRSENSGK